MRRSEPHFSRAGGFAAFGGVISYGLSAFLHPSTAPHQTQAAFAHYAAEARWGLIHLGEFLGILLMAAAGLALAWRLRRGATGWTMLASAALIVFTSIYAVFIAVDGVALGIMVNRWASASPDEQELFYETAFAVRQIEAGLFGMQWLVFGIAVGLFSAAFFTSAALAPCSRWRTGMGWLSAAASVGAIAFGIVQVQTGFTEISMAFQAGLLVGVVWSLAVAAFLFKHSDENADLGQEARAADPHR